MTYTCLIRKHSTTRGMHSTLLLIIQSSGLPPTQIVKTAARFWFLILESPVRGGMLRNIVNKRGTKVQMTLGRSVILVQWRII